MLPHCSARNGAKKAGFLIYINADRRVGDATVRTPKLPTFEAENRNKNQEKQEQAKGGSP